jgi:23S rRNA pseudouridine1911/1915/1917 synthase
MTVKSDFMDRCCLEPPARDIPHSNLWIIYPKVSYENIMPVQYITAQLSDIGERIDKFLARTTGITRSQVQKLIENCGVLVNERRIDQNYRIRIKDVISVSIAGQKANGLSPEAIPLDVFYEDEDLIVVNKPAGMVVYPAAGHDNGTLMNALSYHCGTLAGVGGPLRPGVVHRLDKDTSGLMVIALNDKAYYGLVEQFRRRTIKRMYLSLVYGDLKGDEGEIAARIGRSESDRKKMSTKVKKGKEAITKWKVIKRFGKATLTEVRLGTGRTHQIRVHFASAGHPVLGDRTYGKKVEVRTGSGGNIRFPRQMLHAGVLGFSHPLKGEYLEFFVAPPEDMAQKIEELEILKGPGK